MISTAALRYKILSLPLLVLLLLCVSTHVAIGQQTQSQPNPPAQPKPIPLPHLYFHFLMHQSDLDSLAAKFTAEGKNGQALRISLQTRLGFSDADYAPIRTSSQRLASEVQPIQEQLKALGASPSNASQIHALISQRDSYISSEMYNLSLELTSQNKTALEDFMAKFFAPKPITIKIPPSAGQPSSNTTGKAGQQ
jgi:hypothetical protein